MPNVQGYLKEHTNPPVFLISAVLVVLFVPKGIISLPTRLQKLFGGRTEPPRPAEEPEGGD